MNEQQNGGFTAVAIVTAVIGGIALAGAGTTAAFAAVNTTVRTDQSDSIDVAGVDELSVDASAGDVTIRFADVDRAELTVTGSSREWKLERDDETLRLHSPDWWNWGGSWWRVFDDWNNDETVELVLPNALAGSDLDASINAGSLDADGDFGEVDLDVSAGSGRISGTADSLDADVSAGRADIVLSGVEDASLGLSAGDLVAVLDGTAPSEVEIGVSAGTLELTLPDAEYDVRQDVSAGNLDNRLQTSTNARSVVLVDLSAGTVKLRAGD